MLHTLLVLLVTMLVTTGSTLYDLTIKLFTSLCNLGKLTSYSSLHVVSPAMLNTRGHCTLFMCFLLISFGMAKGQIGKLEHSSESVKLKTVIVEIGNLIFGSEIEKLNLVLAPRK